MLLELQLSLAVLRDICLLASLQVTPPCLGATEVGQVALAERVHRLACQRLCIVGRSCDLRWCVRCCIYFSSTKLTSFSVVIQYRIVHVVCRNGTCSYSVETVNKKSWWAVFLCRPQGAVDCREEAGLLGGHCEDGQGTSKSHGHSIYRVATAMIRCTCTCGYTCVHVLRA